ncbi:hypothetical protein M0R72_11570 [Candidatus Pacearchaeota archaeon]|jgi:hypothetical protein|nr:hypothetical protein [Candidatus Pacearchaeota archaeon]
MNDRLEGLINQKTTALEAIRAAANVSVTYAYGILEEAHRQLDILSSKAKPLPDSGIKTAGQLFTRAYEKWGIYRAKVLRVLNINDPKEIDDFEDAWRKLEDAAKREKFGGQEG